MHRPTLLLGLVIALGGSALGSCTLDTRDLDAFRETAHGPAKLSAVLHDGSRKTALRAEAALRLLDLERSDVDGRALLLEGLRQLDASARRALVPTFERGLSARMATAVGSPPSELSVRAKDVGVRILPLLDPPARAALGASILRWVGADLDRRADCGEFSLEAITERVGAASAAPSAESLRPNLGPKSLRRLSDAVAKHADPATRATAAAKVIAVEQAYRSSPARERDVADYALPALGRFVDTDEARDRLLAIALDPTIELSQRQQALTLTAEHVTGRDVPALQKLALDESAPLELRLPALAQLGQTRAAAALAPLLLLTAHHTRALRQPAVELAIELGGERTLPEVFAALPQTWKVTYAKSEIEAYVARATQLPASSTLVTFMGRKLFAYFWWQNVIAVRYLAQRATLIEATWRLKLHVDDTKEVLGDGWPPGWTVGREVALGLKALAER